MYDDTTEELTTEFVHNRQNKQQQKSKIKEKRTVFLTYSGSDRIGSLILIQSKAFAVVYFLLLAGAESESDAAGAGVGVGVGVARKSDAAAAAEAAELARPGTASFRGVINISTISSVWSLRASWCATTIGVIVAMSISLS